MSVQSNGAEQKIVGLEIITLCCFFLLFVGPWITRNLPLQSEGLLEFILVSTRAKSSLTAQKYFKISKEIEWLLVNLRIAGANSSQCVRILKLEHLNVLIQMLKTRH